MRNPIIVIVSAIALLVASAIALCIIRCLKASRKRRDSQIDLFNLTEGQEIVWVGGYPYVVGGERR